MHSLLRRQLKKHFGSETPPPELAAFLQAVEEAYGQADADRLLLERSLELSSRELMQANADLRAIFQAHPDLFIRLDAEGRILDTRGGARRDFGFALERAEGTLVTELPNAAIARAFATGLAELARTGQPVVRDYTVRSPRGEACFEARLLPVNEGRIVAVVRDVTPQVKAAQIVARQRAFLRQVIDMDPNLLFAKNREGRFTLVNNAVAEAFGTTVDNILGNTDGAFTPTPEQVESFRAADLRVIETGEDLFVAEEPITDAHGRVRWLQTSKRRIYAENGEPQVLGVSSDITARREAELHLRERTERLLRFQEIIHELALQDEADQEQAIDRILASAAPAMAVERLSYWRYIEADGGFELQRAWYRGELTSPQLRLDLSDHPEHAHAITQARVVAISDMATDPLTRDSYERLARPMGLRAMLDIAIRVQGRLTGVLRFSHLDTPRTWSPEEQGFASSIADFVALAQAAGRRRALEEQLRQSQKMEAVGVLAGGVAHDFNNLLTAILGYCHLGLARLTAEHPARACSEEILKAAERAAGLTKQLLAYSRKQVLAPRLLNPNEVITGMEGLLRRLIGEDIALETRLAPEPGRVQADPSQLDQVLMNLVVNAREAMPAGGRVIIETEVLPLTATPLRDRPQATAVDAVVLRVTDTGIGMTAETISRIFEPFFTTKAVGKGSGLGLSMAYGIVEQSGGRLEVSSVPGQGSTFSVYLPRVAEAPAVPADPGAATPHRLAAPPRLATILLVEDEEQLRRLETEALERRGHRVLSAPHGAAALELCRAFPGRIDLLVTDMVMPGMNGRELHEAVVALRPEIQVLYISGHVPGSVVQQGAFAPGLAYLAKPFGLDQLAGRVQELLAA